LWPPSVGIAPEFGGGSPRLQVTLSPRLIRALRELPIVEPRAEAADDRLVLLRAFVVADQSK
jgi:hypothetical protein